MERYYIEFEIFGFPIYKHVKQDKLELGSMKCMFFRYTKRFETKSCVALSLSHLVSLTKCDSQLKNIYI